MTPSLNCGLLKSIAAVCVCVCVCVCVQLGARVQHVKAGDVRPVNVRDFAEAFRAVKPSVDASQIADLETWTRQYGTVG